MSMKLSMDFGDFRDLETKIKQASKPGALTEAYKDTLQASADYVNEGLERAMQKHNRTGRTLKSLQKNAKIKETNGLLGKELSIDVGFKIGSGKNTNIASIVLMHGAIPHNIYGTPRTKPAHHPGIEADKELYNAAFGRNVESKIRDIQRKSLEKTLDKILDGRG